jgi:hypothetical protein
MDDRAPRASTAPSPTPHGGAVSAALAEVHKPAVLGRSDTLSMQCVREALTWDGGKDFPFSNPEKSTHPRPRRQMGPTTQTDRAHRRLRAHRLRRWRPDPHRSRHRCPTISCVSMLLSCSVLDASDHGNRLGCRVVGGLVHDQTTVDAIQEFYVPVGIGIRFDFVSSGVAWVEAAQVGSIAARAFPHVFILSGDRFGEVGDSSVDH